MKALQWFGAVAVLGTPLVWRMPAGAQEAAPKAETAPKTEEDQRVNIDHADHMRYDGQKKLFFLTGNVQMTHKEVTLYCDEARYNEEADTARAVGHLRVVDPDNNLTGDLINADFGKKLIVITGNVRLVTQRKPKPETAGAAPGTPPAAGTPPETPPAAPAETTATGSERPEHFQGYREKLTTITCERIDDWYDEKRVVATGNVKAVQEDKTVTAADAVYDEDRDIVVLTGNPVRVVMENGNQFETPKATISVEEDWVEADTVRAVMKREEKATETPPKAPEGGTPQPEQPAPPH